MSLCHRSFFSCKDNTFGGLALTGGKRCLPLTHQTIGLQPYNSTVSIVVQRNLLDGALYVYINSIQKKSSNDDSIKTKKTGQKYDKTITKKQVPERIV